MYWATFFCGDSIEYCKMISSWVATPTNSLSSDTPLPAATAVCNWTFATILIERDENLRPKNRSCGRGPWQGDTLRSWSFPSRSSFSYSHLPIKYNLLYNTKIRFWSIFKPFHIIACELSLKLKVHPCERVHSLILSKSDFDLLCLLGNAQTTSQASRSPI